MQKIYDNDIKIDLATVELIKNVIIPRGEFGDQVKP